MLKLFKSPVLRQYAVVIIANSCVINLGLSVVWASPMLVKLRAEDQTILSRPPTENEEAWIVSINALVGIMAFFAIGPIMNYLGRKTLILLVYVPRLLTCLIKILATEVWMVLLARSLAGVTDLMTIVMVSTYVAEIAGKEIRGASGTLMQIMSALGMMIMFSVGPYVSYLAINVTMICIAAVTFVPLLFIPETPYYLYSKGHTQAAVEVLTLLRGTEELAHEEIKDYSHNTDSDVNKWALLKDRTVIKTFALVIFLSIGLIMNGYNAVNFYLQTIFEATQTSVSSELSSLIIGVIQLIACFCTFVLTDRFGRKPILYIYSVYNTYWHVYWLGLEHSLFYEGGYEITGFLNYLPLISIMIIIFAFNAGMGSLFWMLVAELFEGPIRPYGVSCSVFVSGFFNFLLSLFFPAVTNSIGPPATYYTFAVCCVIVCLVIFLFVPETKGRSFAEIQTALGRKDLKQDIKDNIKA